MNKLNLEAFRLIKSGLTLANVNVLSSVVNKFGYNIRLSYRDMEYDLGMTYENIRYHFKALEKLGYLTIEKRSTRKFVFHINMEKANELFG